MNTFLGIISDSEILILIFWSQQNINIVWESSKKKRNEWMNSKKTRGKKFWVEVSRVVVKNCYSYDRSNCHLLKELKAHSGEF